jgi:hypothetical protein
MLFVRVMSGPALCSGTGSSFFTACLTDLYLEYFGGVAVVQGSFSSDMLAVGSQILDGSAMVLLSQCAPRLLDHGRNKYLWSSKTRGKRNEWFMQNLVQDEQTRIINLVLVTRDQVPGPGLCIVILAWYAGPGGLECSLQRLIGRLVDLDSPGWP